MDAVVSTRSEYRALLEARDVRIDVSGACVCDGLGFRTTGSRVLVLGAPRALFAAATGLAPVVRGSLTVRGVPAAKAAASAAIAGAALDPPLPPQWTATDYVAWSARLGGRRGADARGAAAAAIDRMQLGPMAKDQLARLVPHARRATVIAAALALPAEILALEDPLSGLPDDTASAFGAILAEALEGRSWLVFAPRLAADSKLAGAADDAILCTGSRFDAQGAPAELLAQTRRFVARFAGDAGPLSSLLEARGGRFEQREAHVVLDLGAELTTSELFTMCDETGIAVLELVPVVRSLTSL